MEFEKINFPQSRNWTFEETIFRCYINCRLRDRNQFLFEMQQLSNDKQSLIWNKMSKKILSSSKKTKRTKK